MENLQENQNNCITIHFNGPSSSFNAPAVSEDCESLPDLLSTLSFDLPLDNLPVTQASAFSSQDVMNICSGEVNSKICSDSENVDYKAGSSSATDEENDAIDSWCAAYEDEENESKSSPMKTSHLYQQDDNAALSSIFHSRYKVAMELSHERKLRQESSKVAMCQKRKLQQVSSKVQSVAQKVPRCMSLVEACCGIKCDEPLIPMTVKSNAQERIRREKLNCQPTAVAMCQKRKLQQVSSKVQSVAQKVPRCMSLVEACCGIKCDEPLIPMTVKSNAQERIRREKLNCQPTAVAMCQKRKLQQVSSKVQSVAQKVPRCMSLVEACCGIKCDEPLIPMTVKSNAQERIRREKLNCQPTAVAMCQKRKLQQVSSKVQSVAQKVPRCMSLVEACCGIKCDEPLIPMTVKSNAQERIRREKLNCQPTAVLPSLKEPVKSIFSRYGSRTAAHKKFWPHVETLEEEDDPSSIGEFNADRMDGD